VLQTCLATAERPVKLAAGAAAASLASSLPAPGQRKQLSVRPLSVFDFCFF